MYKAWRLYHFTASFHRFLYGICRYATTRFPPQTFGNDVSIASRLTLIYPHGIKKKKRVNPLAGGRHAGLDQVFVINGAYQLDGNNTRGYLPVCKTEPPLPICPSGEDPLSLDWFGPHCLRYVAKLRTRTATPPPAGPGAEVGRPAGCGARRADYIRQ